MGRSDGSRKAVRYLPEWMDEGMDSATAVVTSMVAEFKHMEKVYHGPSAAHEWALKIESMPGTTHPIISHEQQGFVVRWKERKICS